MPATAGPLMDDVPPAPKRAAPKGPRLRGDDDKGERAPSPISVMPAKAGTLRNKAPP
jgi:hypothetical protein